MTLVDVANCSSRALPLLRAMRSQEHESANDMHGSSRVDSPPREGIRSLL